MIAASTGVTRVLVNGAVTVVDGEPTGARPGTVLRSGRDTDTVTVH
jgi:N-acyl-D-aspartate/D-glutamate deacylase